MSHAFELLQAAASTMTHEAIAARLGYRRPSVSLYLAGKYPGNVARIEAAIVAKFDVIACPFLDRNLTRDECNQYARRDCPTSSPMAVRHWQACQGCPHKTQPEAVPV